MSKPDSYYIVALREPGSHDKPSTYVLCKTIASVQRKRGKRKGGKGEQSRDQDDTIATFLDEQFGPEAAGKRYEAIAWDMGQPIQDGGPDAAALFLGTADE